MLALFLAILAGGCASKSASGPTERGYDPASTSDSPRFVGLWSIDTLAGGWPADMPDQEQRREADLFKQQRFEFAGNRLTITTPERQMQFSVSLNETVFPKEMTLLELPEQPPKQPATPVANRPAPERRECIYKFEGGFLFVAYSVGIDTRPSEFNPRPKVRAKPGEPEQPGVALLLLRRIESTAKPELRATTK